MSITNETIKNHLKDPAIFCCQRKKGLVISEHDLEDPTLFDDMVEAGLMTLSDDGLTIEQVLGRTLTSDADALTPITADMLDGINETSEASDQSKTCNGKEKVEAQKTENNKMLHIEISKLEGLKLDIPAGMLINQSPELEKEPAEDKVIRTLVKKYYKVNEVKLGLETSFEGGVLTIDKNIVDKAIKADPLVKELKMDIITPDNRHVYTETIMDVCPISTKAEGKIGEGISHILDGAVFMLTGVDEDGVQVHEFGSSEGYLDEKMKFGRPGCADENDIIIRVHAVIQKGTGMERRGPFAAHAAEDVIIQEVRNIIKKTSEPVEKEKVCRDVKKYGRPRVVLVKEIMGQGAMHDNVLCPTEPAGIHGGQKNVDLGNVPIMMTPNQVRDGAIHALTCIGPATKEMTRHYFREPLVEGLAEDDEVDLIGVIFVGSPQVNDEKSYVSERLGTLVETLEVEGAIVTTEGFGNNHIDFTSHIEQIGMRGIPVVGVSFCAYQGQLVVGNKYMDAMIEINKDKDGFENEIAGCSSITKEDADRAILMLKTKMAGTPIEPADRKWKQEVIDKNQKIVDEVLGK
ncbi:MAG: D-proline reductase (dithiol) proprotein PrdA [Clostridium sp.]|jgi:D-proline reductase (dithiol) PrdA|uniref:D-proline reductase (dithiol) proprotein PrdA n=1 Tax=Clostridium sp. TaxID=1506 RepID=UPI0025C26BF6|nr:D-proline reductase (dithiol) proprotein PrdA [Clostridium sp.]MCH3965755.1 D-proline reductase (dithiol) proprotein PrdA [Clostridium sp.]MCI1717164.1 D-proline reductase (dithiol) proprotein PrdA [Clostridium sp.]MCI1801504.1 D-proline reductase (dithiol) proprotein PrdA [Clostridium sp.]MCI1815365.1 D-proline reductase (dithiol) proprotein PrdA [Clostridium sp.]MCI1872268.1 D-proline reductase (dithiol) proprotein PrdA [Clostridium sp.]